MESQNQVISSEDNFDMSDSDDYSDYPDYYGHDFEDDIVPASAVGQDHEQYDYTCLKDMEVERFLNERVEELSKSIHVTPSLAKLLLYVCKWDYNSIVQRYQTGADELLVSCHIKPGAPSASLPTTDGDFFCLVCCTSMPLSKGAHLACGHDFCEDCWASHFQIQVTDGASRGIQCMANKCSLLVPEDFALSHISCPRLREKYQQFAFTAYVDSHPELRFCPGVNCNIVIRVKEPKAKRVVCTCCKTQFCCKCGCDYHAPTDCQTIKKWLTKCADDSETANYISAHTKDCPKCHICIEKNGGCNHMQCSNCKSDFCWMCMASWKSHGSEYYECSRYRDNPDVVNESVNAQAREALKKYLHYYERWENHSKSLKLEASTVATIKSRITDKVMKCAGTWIDWQYLIDASNLLAKCRYTLQYTYPYAYYLEPGSKKDLFEYQQAQLEANIENLSWKIERAEMTDRGDLENQMDIVEKRRTTLLSDFQEP